MRASRDLMRVPVTFDEAGLVQAAGLLPAAALAQRVDLAGLIDDRLTLDAHGAQRHEGAEFAGTPQGHDVRRVRPTPSPRQPRTPASARPWSGTSPRTSRNKERPSCLPEGEHSPYPFYIGLGFVSTGGYAEWNEEILVLTL